MLIPLRQIRLKAEWHGRNIALAAVGGVLIAIGVGFLVAALWIVLADQFGRIVASLVIGVLFAGAGLVVFALRRATPEPVIPPIGTRLRQQSGTAGLYRPRGEFPPLLEAFMFGAETYLQIRNRSRRR